ncbi:MAG: hypothetical protein ACE5H0_14355 [Bacteroidota bacterium]
MATEPLSQLNIDCAKRYQKIDGFGSSLWGGFTVFERGNFDDAARGVRYRTTAEQRKHLLKLLFSDLRCTHVRVWIQPAGIEMQNDNDDPKVMNWNAFNWEGDSKKAMGKTQRESRRNGLREWGEFLSAAREAGSVTWIPTPGGMPPWLKEGLSRPPDDAWFEEYAEWAAAHLLFLKRTFGMEAPYWTFHNEADHIRHARTTVFWKRWVKAVGNRFRKEGLKTKLMIPDYMNVYKAVPLVAEVLKDRDVRQFVGALAYHHYRSSGDGPQPFLAVTSNAKKANAGTLFDKLTGGAKCMAALGKQYNIPSWQTETAYYPRNVKELTEWEIARGRANEIYYELISGASAIQGMFGIWVDAIDPRYQQTVRYEGHHIVMKSVDDNVVGWEVTKDCGVIFAHYARFVEPGDVRVEATCADPFIQATAFISFAKSHCAAVLVNNGGTKKSIQIQIRSLKWPSSFCRAVFTDGEHTWRSKQVIRSKSLPETYVLELAPLSVTTFVLARNPAPGPFSRDFLNSPGCREEYRRELK